MRKVEHVDGDVLARLKILPEVKRAVNTWVLVRVELESFRVSEVVASLSQLSLVLSYAFLRSMTPEVGCILRNR